LERAVLGGLLEVPIDSDALSDSLLHARLSRAAYASSESDLYEEMSVLGCNLLRFEKQPVSRELTHPQWFVCERLRGSRKEIVVAVRGTGSVNDALSDLVIEPEMHITGDLIHKGFLEGAVALWTSGLKDELDPDRIGGCDVTFTGHSYGGALVLVLLGMGLLPEGSAEPTQGWIRGRAAERPPTYKVFTFGAPAVFHGKAAHIEMLKRAVVEQWICEDDVVPRLLGSDFSSLQRLAGLVMTTTVDDATLRKVQGYEHLHTADLRILRDGRAFRVPTLMRRQLLQVNGVLADLPKAIRDHRMSGYVEKLQNLLLPQPPPVR